MELKNLNYMLHEAVKDCTISLLLNGLVLCAEFQGSKWELWVRLYLRV